jgi:hypothetical protein
MASIVLRVMARARGIQPEELRKPHLEGATSTSFVLMKYNIFVPYLMTYYFCSSNNNTTVSVTRLLAVEVHSERHSRPASCACKLPEYYFLEATCASGNSDVYGSRCGHH